MNWKQIIFFYVIISQCKWVSGVDTYEAEIAADSMIWELFGKKSAECLNLHNSFITISDVNAFHFQYEGPSIKNVSNLEGGSGKQLVKFGNLKNYQHGGGEGGVKNQ